MQETDTPSDAPIEEQNISCINEIDEYASIFKEHYGKVLAYCITILEDMNMYAEDIAQKVFLIALFDGKIKEFKSNSSLSTFLCAIASNLVRKEMYSHDLHEKLIRENTEKIYMNTHFDFNIYEIHKKESIEFKNCIDKLYSIERFIINEYYFNGKSIIEIAEELGKSNSTVHRHLHIAVEKLRQMISL